jgi:ribose transport system substrate-binding protein
MTSLAVASAAACTSSTTGGSANAGSSSSSGPGGAPSGSAGTSQGLLRAQQATATAVTIPASIAENVTLPKAPPAGVKAAILVCAGASCSLGAAAFRDAAAALHWNATVITYNTATPGAAVQQAIDAGNKYIVMESVALSTITPQVQAAKRQGVKLFDYPYAGDSAAGAENGLYGVAGGAAFGQHQGRALADYVIANSRGSASVVDVTIPIYPIFNELSSGARAEFQANCPGCSFDTLSISVNQLASGQSPSAIVGYLQSHPKVNYVMLSFADMFSGLPAALKAAGLSHRVKIIGSGGQTATMQSVEAGTSSAWVILPQNLDVWVTADWMARLATGAPISSASLAQGDNLPIFLVTNAAQASRALSFMNNSTWPGPSGFQGQFKRLWKVG